MTHAEWQTSTDPAKMLQWLTSDATLRKPSPRQLRLFAVACCRAVWDRLTDPRSRRAVEVAELYADGLATDEEFNGALRDAYFAWEAAGGITDNTRSRAAFLAWSATAPRIQGEHPGRFSEDAAKLGVPQVDYLRTIIGDPFDPVKIDPQCDVCGGTEAVEHPSGGVVNCPNGYDPDSDRPYWIGCKRSTWLTPDVHAIAQRIYTDRDWDAMSLLADALQEAGCDDMRVLEWLRGDVRCVACGGNGGWLRDDTGRWEKCECCAGGDPIQPVRCRGDWCLDLVLGKE